MATFISLISFTDQGIRNVKKSPRRAGQFGGLAENLGVSVKDSYWSVGSFDVVAIVEGSDEQVTAALLTLGALGNVRTQTLHAYSGDEISRIIDTMP